MKKKNSNLCIICNILSPPNMCRISIFVQFLIFNFSILKTISMTLITFPIFNEPPKKSLLKCSFTYFKNPTIYVWHMFHFKNSPSRLYPMMIFLIWFFKLIFQHPVVVRSVYCAWPSTMLYNKGISHSTHRSCCSLLRNSIRNTKH